MTLTQQQKISKFTKIAENNFFFSTLKNSHILKKIKEWALLLIQFLFKRTHAIIIFSHVSIQILED